MGGCWTKVLGDDYHHRDARMVGSSNDNPRTGIGSRIQPMVAAVDRPDSRHCGGGRRDNHHPPRSASQVVEAAAAATSSSKTR